MTTSAPRPGALASMRALLPGTASSERCRRSRSSGMGGAVCGRPRRRASGHRAIPKGAGVGSIHRASDLWVGAEFFACARSGACGTLPGHADPDAARSSRPAALRPRPVRRGAVRPRRDAAADARPPRSRLPRDPRRGRRDAARRLAHAGGRRPRAARHRHDRDGGRAGEPARAGRDGDRRRGRVLRRAGSPTWPSARARASCGSRRRWGRPSPTRRCSTRSTPTPRRTSSRSSTRRRRRAPSTRCASWARRSPATTRCSWPTA